MELVSIATICSHSALNIFKGAKEEGFRTVGICKPQDRIVYEKYPLVDEFIIVNDYKEILTKEVQEKLIENNSIIIPHGSFNAYLSQEDICNNIKVPMFANRKLLVWETNRELQKTLLERSGLKIPKTILSPKEINRLVIAKYQGAKGGRGYFLAHSEKTFYEKLEIMRKKNLIYDNESIYLQEYILGVNIYPTYFHSLLNNEVEFFGFDKRYESFVDNIGRVPSQEQLALNINPTYTIVGNIPITIRESLLPEILRMGDKIVEETKKIAPPGIVGPFCLETVITENLEIITFEISMRIVAGTNVGVPESIYTYLKYGNNMYMGRRIALEIKNALKLNAFEKIIT